MKKLYSITLLFFITASISYSQSGWFWQNPLPTGVNYYDVKFTNETTAYAVGCNATIIKSTDKGITWRVLKQNYATNDTLFSIFFINENTGFTCGRIGANDCILKTNNGGINWYSSINGLSSVLYSIYFPSRDTGYSAGMYGLLYKTTNSGQNWLQIPTNYSGQLKTVQFVNNLTGFIGGTGGFIRKTTNGGLTWSIMDLNVNNYEINSVYFLNQSTGYTKYTWSSPPYYSGTRIFRTTNLGINWSYTDLNSGNGGKINFINNETGFITGGLIKTTNSGTNWFYSSIPTVNFLNAIAYNGISNILGIGVHGTIVSSSDTSNSWSNTSSIGERANLDIHFLSENVGFIAGGNGIYKTTDGGTIWVLKNAPSNSYYKKLSFADNLIGYAIGSMIIKSTDSGENWEQLSYTNIGALTDIYAINQDTVFITKNGGKILRTFDGGNTWTETIVGTWDINVYGICFTNKSIGYASTSEQNNSILKTTNCGLNWEYVPMGLAGYVRTNIIKKIDSLNIYASALWTGGYGILSSSNAGLNWIKSGAYGMRSCLDVEFINRYIGYYLSIDYEIGGYSLWKTLNEGINWHQVPLIFDNSRGLNGLEFVNENTGCIIGQSGLILRTTNGGNTIGILSSSLQIPRSFSLHQNYPNPFNPVTNIRFGIPALGNGGDRFVKLIVYDLLGREVATLVNEQLKPGSYEVDWDGSGFASGVYFYSLVTPDFVETKRMVLIK